MEITIQLELLIIIASVFTSISAAVIALAVKGIKAVGRIKALEVNMENIHEGCPLPIDSIPKMQSEIKKLQEQDTEIFVKLTEMNTVLTQTNTMTTKMFDHFFNKGINSDKKDS